LAHGIEASPCASLKWPAEANEVFLKAQPNVLAWLKEQGCQFHIWPGFDDVGRLVCSHETEKDDIDRFIQLLNQAPQ
jgi:threonine aldolase